MISNFLPYSIKVSTKPRPFRNPQLKEISLKLACNKEIDSQEK
jgi:hypothetical protein